MSHTIVIFGASGDLTSRKLIPALYELRRKARLPGPIRVVGFSRTPYSHEAWREDLGRAATEHLGQDFQGELWNQFAQDLFYQPGDIGKAADFVALRETLEKLEGEAPATRIYYLATAPAFYEPAVAHLGAAGMAGEAAAPRRLVVEKPFGKDRASAAHLNECIHEVFAEHQIYRIDHYLGKETVQNLVVLRFANTIFEPLWNRNLVEHVQITAAEPGTIGHRAGYYDTAGVLRDMFQNHLLQLLTLTAMEAPARFDAVQVRDEKVKVLRAIRPLRSEDVAWETIRGQYEGYGNEQGVRPGSSTATFAAVKLHVDNWRWQGVPFYLRSGKAMECSSTQIVIQFREPPHMLFDGGRRTRFEANRLVIQIQPAEGIQLHFQTKVPDAGMQLRMTDLDFRFQEIFNSRMPEAYQRLLLDVMAGDASLFARADEVELAWGIIDPIQASWEEDGQPALEAYPVGQWGPLASWEWMLDQGRQWFDQCPVLTTR